MRDSNQHFFVRYFSSEKSVLAVKMISTAIPLFLTERAFFLPVMAIDASTHRYSGDVPTPPIQSPIKKGELLGIPGRAGPPAPAPARSAQAGSGGPRGSARRDVRELEVLSRAGGARPPPF